MEIEHDLQESVFRATVDGKIAYVSYRIANGALIVEHTIVPRPIEGRGIASVLVKAAYDYALTQELATCSYAARWLERHPEYMG